MAPKKFGKGWLKSEGMTPQIADDIRKERTLKVRHGEPVLTAKQIKRRRPAPTEHWMKLPIPISNSVAAIKDGASLIGTV